jgi:micrococcal nuclease
MKWYQKAWVIILFLIFFAPIGIILVWWQKPKWNKNIKWTASIFAAIWFLIIAVSGQSQPPQEYNAKKESKKIASKDTKTESKKESTKTKATEETAKVTRIIDGDTIEVSLNGKTEKVRLIGVNTPEEGRPYFDEATAKTKELCYEKEVVLKKDVSERDRYGRLLRYVYIGNLFLNSELVKQGYANSATYPPDVKYSDLFVQLEKEARSKQIGLWTTTSQPKAATESIPTTSSTATTPQQSNEHQKRQGSRLLLLHQQHLKRNQNQRRWHRLLHHKPKKNRQFLQVLVAVTLLEIKI